MKLLTTQSPQLSCYLVPLRPKYIFQYLILRHTQIIFLPNLEPSFILKKVAKL
jgi:hypothetical protein